MTHSEHFAEPKKYMSLSAFVQIYLRSFFFQGSFSAKQRQNLGFAFCLEPFGKKLWKDHENRIRFFLRHTEDYNGNPFMAPLVIGAVANMEEKLHNGEGTTIEDIHRFKKAVGPATGSSGDRLFWSNLRPFTILVGIASSLYWGGWGIGVFLTTFIIPILVLKWHWLSAGYRLGPKVVYEIKNQRLDTAESFMEIAGTGIAAFVTVVFTASEMGFFPSHFTGAVVLFTGSFALLMRNIPLHIVFPLALIIASIVCFLI